MNLAYVDCFSGISGDMTLGALVDAGCDVEHLRSELHGLQVHGWELSAEKVWKNGMAATYVKVRTEDQSKHRSLSTILDILQKSQLAPQVRGRAAAIFKKLGEAEARVHDVPLEKVHFHEVGAVDAIVDVVGACIAFHALGIEQFACSALNVGGGTAKMAHGILPVPAPATANLLQGKPTYSNVVQAAGYERIDVADLCRDHHIWCARLSRATPHAPARVCMRRHKFRRRAHQDFPRERPHPARRTRIRRLPQTSRPKKRAFAARHQ